MLFCQRLPTTTWTDINSFPSKHREQHFPLVPPLHFCEHKPHKEGIMCHLVEYQRGKCNRTRWEPEPWRCAFVHTAFQFGCVPPDCAVKAAFGAAQKAVLQYVHGGGGGGGLCLEGDNTLKAPLSHPNCFLIHTAPPKPPRLILALLQLVSAGNEREHVQSDWQDSGYISAYFDSDTNTLPNLDYFQYLFVICLSNWLK